MLTTRGVQPSFSKRGKKEFPDGFSLCTPLAQLHLLKRSGQGLPSGLLRAMLHVHLAPRQVGVRGLLLLTRGGTGLLVTQLRAAVPAQAAARAVPCRGPAALCPDVVGCLAAGVSEIGLT